MAHVVIGVANYRVQVRLVLVQHGSAIIVRIRIRIAIGVNNAAVVGYQFQANGDVVFINTRHAIDRSDNRRLTG